MTEPALFSVTTQVLRSLADVINRPFDPLLEVRLCIGALELPDVMLNLKKELESLQGFLGDAQERQEHDDEVKRWMSRIKDLAYEAQDITEKHLNRIERHSKQQQQQRRCCCNPLNSLRALPDAMVLKMEASKIYSLTDKISRLTSKMKAYGIEFRPVESPRPADPVLRVVDEEEMPIIGLNEDIKAIENQLIYAGSTNVIGVCGANGLGKTTLVREVLRRSTLVKEHFEAVAWAFLGEDLQVRGVLEKILSDLLPSVDEVEREKIAQQVQAAAGSGNHESLLCEMISRILKENKCLVVLDDFQAQDTWNNDALRCALSPIQSADSSSKLVLTTCDASVLSFVDCRGYLHQPRCLGSAERWQLFQKKAGEGIQDSAVKDMARRIVEGPIVGLPLTIHVLGGIFANDTLFLRCKLLGKGIYDYLAFLGIFHMGLLCPIVAVLCLAHQFKSSVTSTEKSLLFGKPTDEVGIQEVLKLSYETLSRRIRSCLLEMSSHFPEGHEIQAVELIKLWIDKMIVKDEKRGEGCLDELFKRSLIQVVAMETSTGKIKTCQLHSIVQVFYRDMATLPPPLLSRLRNAFKCCR